MTIYPFGFTIPLPRIDILFIHLGPLQVTGYGLMMMVAFLMAGWAIQVDLRRRGMAEEYAADIGFAGYGGLLGGVAAVLATVWWKRVPARWTMELTAAPLALGYALGRVGCFLVNDDYGIPSTLPWAMKFPRGLPPTTVAELSNMHVRFPPGADPMQVVAVHPTQIYETALMLLAFAWLWRLQDHRHGTGWRFGVYLVLAGAERFLVETVRAKDDRLLGPFTLAQVTSVLLVLAGVWLMQRLRAPEPATVAVPPALKPQPQAQATP